jgi:hypothetical protein
VSKGLRVTAIAVEACDRPKSFGFVSFWISFGEAAKKIDKLEASEIPGPWRNRIAASGAEDPEKLLSSPTKLGNIVGCSPT